MKKFKYPSYGQAVLLGLIFIGITIFISLIGGIVLYMTQNVENKFAQDIFMLVGYVIPLSITIWIGMLLKAKWNEEKRVFYFKQISPLTFIKVIIPILAIVLLTEPIVELIPMPESIAKLFQSFLGKGVINLLLVTIFAPILEEALFRGVILDGFLQRYSPKASIIVSSILFGVIHLNPWQFIPAFAGGLFMGWIYYRTRNLWICIWLHFIVNFSGFMAFLYADDAMVTVYDLLGNFTIYLSVLGTFTILGVVIIRKLSSNLPRQDWQPELPPDNEIEETTNIESV